MSLPPALGANPGPSVVHVAGRQLIVQKRSLDGTLAPAAPYVMRGVVWSPASKDTTTSATDPNNATVRRPELAKWAGTDVPLVAGMNGNTVRLLIDPGFDATLGPAGLQILDQLYARGIMVIMTVDDAINDTSRITGAVNFYKNHPAVLMWMLGNEWNINLYYGAAGSVADAAQRTESAAALIKSLDTNHPVSTSYGDIDIDGTGLRLADTQHYVNDVAPSVDIWGLNVYRASSFGTLFAQWASISSKPMFLGEFGTDAFFSSCARSNPPDGALDERTQEQWDLGLWNEVVANLSASDSSKVALGGTVFELSDEWWKVQPSGSQQTSGFLLVNGHPDDFANEEYFGIADIDRHPRAVYYGLRRAFSAGSALALPPSRVDFFTLPATVTTNVPAFLVAGTVQKGSRAFINSTEVTVDSGGTFVSRYPLNGAQNLAVGPNAIELRVLGPDGSQTVTVRTVDYEPSFSTQDKRLLYVDSVAPSLPGTIVIDLDAGVFLGLIDQQHVRGISADGSAVYMDTRAVISTASHASLPPLPFSASLPVNGFLVSPLGDYLYSGNEIVNRSSNTLSPSHLPASILTGNSFGGAAIPGGPAITADGQFIYCGTNSVNFTKIDRVSLTATVVPVANEQVFLSDMSLSPDGSLLGRVKYSGGAFQVAFYDTGTLSQVSSVTIPGDFSGELVFSPSGQCAVAGSSGNPANRGGSITAVEIQGFQQRACSLIDLADNLTISSGNELYVSSGTRFGIDVFGLQPCSTLRRSRTYFLGIDQFKGGVGIPQNDEIQRLVLRDLPALSVEIGGTGGGTVTSAPAGITCGSDCMEGYPQGTVVNLTATPDVGSVFAGWSGDPDCSDGTVTMQTAKTCVATFNSQVLTLTVTRTGNGSGTVTSIPSGINCGADCTEGYDYGTQVTLTATPAAGSLFTGWTGDADCSDGVVTMQTAKTCVATFQLQVQTLTVSRTGNGSGTVTSVPAGINCGADCTENYPYATQVTLTATPDAGSVFTGWTGDPDCADGIVALTSGVSCAAEFRTNPIFKDGFESGDLTAWH
ncbi:MAG TPA: glycoside hydrolase family 2 TIM barrel-domain containing protein [Thermoanaerobaculia bacterium]|nr:glycoside hydrolase family 2 TIM barrel-domain containing protein [Thermoanaerobaculia bacterium]